MNNMELKQIFKISFYIHKYLSMEYKLKYEYSSNFFPYITVKHIDIIIENRIMS